MYILTVAEEEREGAFAVENRNGEKVLFMFEEEDDAQRYLSMLEELDYPEMEVTEVNPQVAIMACDNLSYSYAIITPDDIVVPPDYDKVSEPKI
jgi:hypothetical protein